MFLRFFEKMDAKFAKQKYVFAIFESPEVGGKKQQK